MNCRNALVWLWRQPETRHRQRKAGGSCDDSRSYNSDKRQVKAMSGGGGGWTMTAYHGRREAVTTLMVALWIKMRLCEALQHDKNRYFTVINFDPSCFPFVPTNNFPIDGFLMVSRLWFDRCSVCHWLVGNPRLQPLFSFSKQLHQSVPIFFNFFFVHFNGQRSMWKT